MRCAATLLLAASCLVPAFGITKPRRRARSLRQLTWLADLASETLVADLPTFDDAARLGYASEGYATMAEPNIIELRHLTVTDEKATPNLKEALVEACVNNGVRGCSTRQRARERNVVDLRGRLKDHLDQLESPLEIPALVKAKDWTDVATLRALAEADPDTPGLKPYLVAALAAREILAESTCRRKDECFLQHRLRKWLAEEHEVEFSDEEDQGQALTARGWVRQTADDFTRDEDDRLRAAVDELGTSAAVIQQLADRVGGGRTAKHVRSRLYALDLVDVAPILVYEYDANDPLRHVTDVIAGVRPVRADRARKAYEGMDNDVLVRHVEGLWSAGLPDNFQRDKEWMIETLIAAKVPPKYYENGGAKEVRRTDEAVATQRRALDVADARKRSRESAARALGLDGAAPQTTGGSNTDDARYARLRRLQGLLLALKAGATEQELPTHAELHELFAALRWPQFEDVDPGTFDENQHCYICHLRYLLRGGRTCVEHKHTPEGGAVHLRFCGTCQTCNTGAMAEIDFWLDVLKLTPAECKEVAGALDDMFSYKMKPAYQA